MNRRELLKGLMAGGVIVAGELWIPGQKLISIPTGKVFGNEYGLDSCFRLIDRTTVEYCGAEDKVVSVIDFHKWLKRNAAHMLGHGTNEDSLSVSLTGHHRLVNPWHVDNGTLTQAAGDQHFVTDLRETWVSTMNIGGDEMETDKYYTSSAPMLRRCNG